MKYQPICLRTFPKQQAYIELNNIPLLQVIHTGSLNPCTLLREKTKEKEGEHKGDSMKAGEKLPDRMLSDPCEVVSPLCSFKQTTSVLSPSLQTY